jgi:hypothetical protein
LRRLGQGVDLGKFALVCGAELGVERQKRNGLLRRGRGQSSLTISTNSTHAAEVRARNSMS